MRFYGYEKVNFGGGLIKRNYSLFSGGLIASYRRNFFSFTIGKLRKFLSAIEEEDWYRFLMNSRFFLIHWAINKSVAVRILLIAFTNYMHWSHFFCHFYHFHDKKSNIEIDWAVFEILNKIVFLITPNISESNYPIVPIHNSDLRYHKTPNFTKFEFPSSIFK